MVVLIYSNLNFVIIKQYVAAKIEFTKRFSLIMDGWTSLKNRKHLNICLFGSRENILNLEVVYISRNCAKEESMRLIETCLREYITQFKLDTVPTTADGPKY